MMEAPKNGTMMLASYPLDYLYLTVPRYLGLLSPVWDSWSTPDCIRVQGCAEEKKYGRFWAVLL